MCIIVLKTYQSYSTIGQTEVIYFGEKKTVNEFMKLNK